MSKKNPNTLEASGVTIVPDARSKFLTVTVGGQSTRIHYKELWSMLYVLGTPKYQEEMMPVRKEERMVFSRKHEVMTNRDIKKGEKVVFWCEVDVAKTVVAAIAEKEGGKIIEQSDLLSTASVDPAPKAGVQ